MRLQNHFQDGYVLKGPARSLSQTTKLQPGDLYFEDVNEDGVVDDNDKAIIGSPHPDFTYGFNLSGRYKSFDLSASFNGAYGNEVLDGQDYYIFNMEGSGNQYQIVNNDTVMKETRETARFIRLPGELKVTVPVFLPFICKMVRFCVAQI